MNVAVVVPTNRPLIAEFLAAWEPQLRGCHVLVMEDAPQRTLSLPGWVRHLSHADVAAELGDQAWIIPQHSSACRSYGTLKAVQAGADVIWHLDDDCRPEPGVEYLRVLRSILAADVDHPAWWNTLRDGGQGGTVYPRGYPYGVRDQRWPVMIHHGLWSHVPDLDGKTQLQMPDLRLPPACRIDTVPLGAFFPMCGMNLAFRRGAAPLMYMGLQGGDWPYDRFDDMWAGLFAKKAADRLDWAVTSGAPSVRHDRASDATRNAEIEAPGIEVHEELWQHLLTVRFSGRSAGQCYWELGLAVSGFRREPYWQQLAAAMMAWAELTEKTLG